MTETSLHASLKRLYAGGKENQEILVDGYQIDATQGELLIEIQTSNFSALKQKLYSLLHDHPVLLVHPIAIEKWIVKMPASGDNPISRRKSPRRGRLEDLFRELIYISDLVLHPNLQIEVIFVREEEIRRVDGLGSWRRKGVSIIDHRLLDVVDKQRIAGEDAFRKLLPETLPAAFTVQDVAGALSIRRSLASKMIYCLRKIDVVQTSGKRGRATLYGLSATAYNP